MSSKIRQARELRDEGFTLIELLIVIVVLGILAGIVVFGVGTFRNDSKAAVCKADVKTVSVAVDAWNAKMGTFNYPTSAGTTITVANLVTEKYLKAAPTGSTETIASTGVVTGTYDDGSGTPAAC